MKEKLRIVTNGIIKENPVLVLLLGCCSTLAISVTAAGSLGMGAALTFVLICSNMVISALRKIIPDQIRIPCYIVVVATFVTLVQMVVEAYVKSLYDSLGIFLPLIVVNCIVLGRAEMFAGKNGVFDSMLDGLGMGIGYTLVLTIMGVFRELLGSGTLFGLRLIPEGYQLGILTQTPGGFFTFGAMIALLAAILRKKGKTYKPDIGCDGCKLCERAATCGNRKEDV